MLFTHATGGTQSIEWKIFVTEKTERPLGLKRIGVNVVSRID